MSYHEPEAHIENSDSQGNTGAKKYLTLYNDGNMRYHGPLKYIQYNDSQRRIIYKYHILPLKDKISQISLFDYDAATLLNNMYNEIINCKSKKIMDIFYMIIRLESVINSYEKEKGLKIKLVAQIQNINNMIDGLKKGTYSVDDCLNAFLDLKRRCEEMSYQNNKEESISNDLVYELQVNLISKAISVKPSIRIEDLIQEDDEEEFRSAINYKIYQLSQSQDIEEKKRADQMTNMMLIDPKCFYSMRFWLLMNGEEYEDGRINQNLSETNTLPEVYNRRNIKTMIMSLITNFLGLFKREQTTKSQLSDLAKIDIEYLAEQIEKNQSILEDNEKLRLEREGRKNVDEIFIPDARTLIYDFFEGFYDTPIRVKFNKHNGDIIKVYEYNYTDDNGLEKKLIVSGEYFDENSDEARWGENYSFFCEGVKKECRYFPEVHCAIKYVQFVDKILGTDLTKRMLCELEECEIGDTLLYENVIKYKGKEWKVLDKILKSYYEMKEECEKNKFNFRGSEARRRNNFYMKSNFKNRIEVPETEDGKIIGGLLEKNKNGSKKKKKKKDKNKDPEYNNNRPEETEI